MIVIEPMSSPEDARAFKELNLEWITALFGVEPADLHTLDNPRRIVDDGGQVLIAREGDDRVGCVALVAEEPGVFEISKMAVTPRIRGRGVGRSLLDAAIDRAAALGATSLFLASNARLAPAVHLYEAVGFVHVQPEQLRPIPYDRADVFMKFDLGQKVSPV
ncbi:GNAT family N-acetyltransferase [Nocardia spumae]|uniref:GNAT family N-acetyltransferase n=1 Tax=Nocardia spumae TaxID=2887190 RepID=UPI001D15987A|nr:GNAT family N-acetyltransferase [Nocardia spumae]